MQQQLPLIWQYYQAVYQEILAQRQLILQLQKPTSQGQDLQTIVRARFDSKGKQYAIVSQIIRAGRSNHPILSISGTLLNNIKSYLDWLEEDLKKGSVSLKPETDLVILQNLVEIAIHQTHRQASPEAIIAMVESFRTTFIEGASAASLEVSDKIAEGFIVVQALAATLVTGWDIAFYLRY